MPTIKKLWGTLKGRFRGLSKSLRINKAIKDAAGHDIPNIGTLEIPVAPREHVPDQEM